MDKETLWHDLDIGGFYITTVWGSHGADLLSGGRRDDYELDNDGKKVLIILYCVGFRHHSKQLLARPWTFFICAFNVVSELIKEGKRRNDNQRL